MYTPIHYKFLATGGTGAAAVASSSAAGAKLCVCMRACVRVLYANYY